MAILGYLFICVVFGTTFLAIKFGLNEGIPPFFMAAIRFGFAGLILLPLLRMKKIQLPKTWRELSEISFLGFLMTTIPFAALFWAEQHITSGMASLLVATSPMFIGIFGRMDRTQWGGLLVSFLGIGLVVYPDLTNGENLSYSLWAILSIVVSEMAYAYGAVRSKKVLDNQKSPHMFNAVQMLSGSIFLFVLSLSTEQITSITWSAKLIVSVIYLSVVASIIASGIYFWMVKVTNPLFPTTWTIVSPVIAVVAGALVINEPFTWMIGSGTFLTLLGLMLINRGMFTKNIVKQI